MMEYIFNKKIEDDSELGYHIEKIKADLERWQWGVLYKDGTELHQFSNDGEFHQFGEIKQENVKLFSMYKNNEMDKRIDLMCKNNVKYFHFYRNMMLDQGSDNARSLRIYVFGWKNKDNGACSYNYILPDDRIVTADHDIVNILEFNP